MDDKTKLKAAKAGRAILAKEVISLEATLAACENQLKGKDSRAEYLERELSSARRLFMELYEEKRTLSLRFGWLEEKATDVVNSCEEHLPTELDNLREELGVGGYTA